MKKNLPILSRFSLLLALTTTLGSAWQPSRHSMPLKRPAVPLCVLAVANDDDDVPVPLSQLSLTLDELAASLGGRGRAQACWECYRLGVDPVWLNDGDAHSGQEEESGHGGLLNTQGWTRERLRTMVKATQMGKGPLQHLAQFAPVDSTTLAHVSRSHDGTTKLLLTLKGGLQVETVIIPWDDRQRSTLCISSQVGCRQACVFCATGRMGLLKSLTSDEILSQVYWANKVCRLRGIVPVDNVVFMGMGEPADNVLHVVRAAHQLVDPRLFALSAKRVTISTVAPTPRAFLDLARAPAVLAWSVHATNAAKRNMLVPTTRYSMQELREGFLVALRDRSRSLKSTMLEVTLLNGINDSEDDALDLVEFCKPMIAEVPKLVVNLIPWNNIGASTGWAKEFQQPSRERIEAYQQVLTNHGVLCYIRTTRGDDEGSACGQLATRTSRKKLQTGTP